MHPATLNLPGRRPAPRSSSSGSGGGGGAPGPPSSMAHRAGSRRGRLPARPRPRSEDRARPTSCPSAAPAAPSARPGSALLPRGSERGAVGSARGPARTCPPPAGGGGRRGVAEGAGGKARAGVGSGARPPARGGAEAALGQRWAVALVLPGLGTCRSHGWGRGHCVRQGVLDHEALSPNPIPGPSNRSPAWSGDARPGVPERGGAPHSHLLNSLRLAV